VYFTLNYVSIMNRMKQEGPSRRDVLKILTLGSLRLASQKLDVLAPKEKTFPSDSIAYIDMDPTYNNAALLFRVLGISLSPTEFLTQFDSEEKMAEALLDPEKKYQALLFLFLDHFQGYTGALADIPSSHGLLEHGELVADTGRVILAETHWPVPTKNQFFPLQDMIEDLEFQTLEDGVPLLHITLGESPMLEWLQHSDQPIVNMSFQLGEYECSLTSLPSRRPLNYFPAGQPEEGLFSLQEVEIDSRFLDENDKPIGAPQAYILNNGEKDYVRLYTWEELLALPDFTPQTDIVLPSIVIREAYRPEQAEVSFRRLIRICQAFPHKLFVAAAGNYNSFSQAQKEALAQEWPSNLLLTGQRFEKYGECGFRALSNNIADIAIDKDFGKHEMSSSEAVAVMTAVSSIILQLHLDFSPEQICEFIRQELCSLETINGEEIPYLRRSLIQQKLRRPLQ